MKKLLLLFIPILLVSCEARLDDDKRAFFKTRIVDAQGNPVDDVIVEVTNFRTFEFNPFAQSISKFSQPETDFLLGKGTTDSNGETSFLMLFDTAGSYFVNVYQGDQNIYSVSTGIESFGNDLTLDIPLITIRDVADVELDFINTSGTTEAFDLRVNYFDLSCSEVFEDGEFSVNGDCGYFSQIFTTINESPEDGNFEFQAFYPSVITVSLIDESGTETIQEFTVNNPIERYETNY
ncbi:hypothetical protein SAMN05192588_1157 [Nonlabens sp. Hel1_33_55]|uniref:hypothetical protein n=1 Tax=Nonlabens sp. Hel1_33_55 TaxID=1336802 RepID=UPI000875C24A|nr:hypothetical protein [Nonlabens sp. Hel1_33_55]SCY10131.1 hypothetical protein SAMN05192588_1157 [Nonlabens sp. Hel1_33_55]